MDVFPDVPGATINLNCSRRLRDQPQVGEDSFIVEVLVEDAEVNTPPVSAVTAHPSGKPGESSRGEHKDAQGCTRMRKEATA